MTVDDAKSLILSRFEESKVATTALVAALEVLQDNAQLEIPEDVELPLLTPINTMDPEDIAAAVETWLAEGFRTFKVKDGKDVEDDLTRIQAFPKERTEAHTSELQSLMRKAYAAYCLHKKNPIILKH